MRSLIIIYFLVSSIRLSAQTDADAIMMSKNNFCTGFMYSSSHWNEYWEGTLKRNNENLGTVSTRITSIMGNYGISGKLNILFGLPYVQTKASAGVLHGLKGLQDLSLWVKWMPVEKKVGKGILSLYGISGFSFPVSNYVADFLPLSIGLRGNNISLRGMADYQVGNWFATLSGTYVIRSNIRIDRDAYYTTEMRLTNEVAMPDASSLNFRIGYRSSWLIAEALVSNWATLGGFDITRNNMPFPSNRMNATNLGLNIKYNLKAVDGLALIGGGSYTVAGRNMGQTTNISGGVFYVLNFSRKQKLTPPSNSK